MIDSDRRPSFSSLGQNFALVSKIAFSTPGDTGDARFGCPGCSFVSFTAFSLASQRNLPESGVQSKFGSKIPKSHFRIPDTPELYVPDVRDAFFAVFNTRSLVKPAGK